MPKTKRIMKIPKQKNHQTKKRKYQKKRLTMTSSPKTQPQTKVCLMCTRLMKTTFMKSQIVSLDVKCWLSRGLPKQQVGLALEEASKTHKYCVGKKDQKKYYFVLYHIKSSQPILYRYMKRLLIQILSQYYIVLM